LFLNSRKKLGIFFVGGFSLLAGLILIVTATVGGASARAGDLPGEPNAPILPESQMTFNFLYPCAYNDDLGIFAAFLVGLTGTLPSTYVINIPDSVYAAGASFLCDYCEEYHTRPTGWYPVRSISLGGSSYPGCVELRLNANISLVIRNDLARFPNLKTLVLKSNVRYMPAGAGTVPTSLSRIETPSGAISLALLSNGWAEFASIIYPSPNLTIALPPQSGTGWVLL